MSKIPVDTSHPDKSFAHSSVPKGAPAESNGENSAQEIARLRAENERLTAQVIDLEADRKILLEELCLHLPKGATPAEIATLLRPGPCVTGEDFLRDLERITKEFEASKNS